MKRILLYAAALLCLAACSDSTRKAEIAQAKAELEAAKQHLKEVRKAPRVKYAEAEEADIEEECQISEKPSKAEARAARRAEKAARRQRTAEAEPQNDSIPALGFHRHDIPV